MSRPIIIFILLTAVLSSCEKEKEVKYSGIAVFTSEPRGEYFTSGYGFSFEQGKNIICTDLKCTLADIVAVHLILQTEIEEVFLQSPENQEAFHMNALFDTEAEAIDFYDDYGEVIVEDFEFNAGNLQANQVWTFQTVSEKFAKFRIIEILVYQDATYPFAEVRVEYQYQPSGSRIFNR